MLTPASLHPRCTQYRHLSPVLALLCLLSLSAPRASAQEHNHATASAETHEGKLGRVKFPNSGNAAAQKPFLEGLALLHSFEYDRAAQAFRSAQKADPHFALAYWMEALTHSRLLWADENIDSARIILKRLADSSSERLAYAHTQRERSFGAGVEHLYGNGDPQKELTAFADSMRHWAKRTPSDDEANVFAALASLWESMIRRDEAVKLKREATAYAQIVFARNPLHPGAAHYIIHATDNPATAQQGFKAALEYAKIAPESEHALHMPSHIFFALGQWEDMARSNERAWAASRAYVTRTKLPASDNDWHALDWLQYAYLQLGRWHDARALIDTARAINNTIGGLVNPAKNPAAALAAEQLAFRYGIETGQWSDFPEERVPLELNDSTMPQYGRFIVAASIFQRAAAGLRIRNDSIAARNAAAILRKDYPGYARLVDFMIIEARHDRKALIAELEKSRSENEIDAYALLGAVSGYTPSAQLGEALLADGRGGEAVAVYRDELKKKPRRSALLLGLARSQMAAGDAEGARVTYDELSKIWRRADSQVKNQLPSAMRRN